MRRQRATPRRLHGRQSGVGKDVFSALQAHTAMPTLVAMTEPNVAFKAARTELRLSQDELARAIRAAGDKAGEPNGCTKRLVQRWEAGLVSTPRPNATYRKLIMLRG